MESMFDLVLTLVPISLFIALKIYSSQKKKVEEDERVRLAAFLAKAASEETAAKETVREPGPRTTFADLSALVDAAEVDEEPYEPRDPIPIPEVVSVAPVAARPAPRKPAVPVMRPADRFFARMEQMSPLKRAVVMAELLGRPKGL